MGDGLAGVASRENEPMEMGQELEVGELFLRVLTVLREQVLQYVPLERMATGHNLHRLVSSSLLPSQEIDEVGESDAGIAFELREGECEAVLGELEEVLDSEDLRPNGPRGYLLGK